MNSFRGGEFEVHPASADTFMVGDWSVYPNANEIRDASGASVRLETKVMNVLRFLVETPGMVRSKESIIEGVWPDVHVSEDALFRCVRELRRALGDNPRSPKYIETIPKKGYRLVAEVKTDGKSSSATESQESQARVKSRVRDSWPARLGVSGLSLLFLVLVAWLVLSEPVESEGARVGSLAVLPFLTLETQGDDLDYMSIGLSDGVAYSLSRIKGLRVVSNVSSLHYRGGGIVNPRVVARELGVDSLLFGRLVLSEDSSLLVSVELVDGQSNELIWGHTITGSIHELREVQETIVQQIAERLSLQLSLVWGDFPSG